MAEILKEWLSERLKQPIKWEPDEFASLMMDGHIIAELLFSYAAINEEERFLIRHTQALPEIKNNWRHLTTWLKNMDIHLTDTEVGHILEGRGSPLLRLFYQLFLHLDKRDRTNFIKRERKLVSNLVSKIGTRFKVEKVDEEEIPVIEYLAKPLINEKYFIEWQKKKSDQLKQTYDYVRSKYLKTCDRMKEEKIPVKREKAQTSFKMSKEKYDMDQFEKKHPCKFDTLTYEALLELDEKVEEGKKSVLDEQWAQNYLHQLRSKFSNKSETELFHKQMRSVIASSLWEQTTDVEEAKLDQELAKKVLKLSQFEKQMCTQLMETKQQARNLTKNRIDAEREFSAQREQQFCQYLDNLKEQIHLEVIEIDFEKQRQNILHRKLYAEKMKRKRQHYYEICYDTMLSILDYAVKYAYNKLLMGCDIPDHYIHEWKALYFKQQPIFDILERVEDMLVENNEEEASEIETIVHLEMDRQNCQNDNDFQEYLDATGPWSLDILISNFDPEDEERQQEYVGLRVLGHVVYKLLEKKYPLPPVRLPADLPDYTSKAILRGLPDRSITVPMQALLNNRQIHVVRIEAAINYCLKCFKTEMVGCVDIELSFDKFIAASSSSDKDLLKFMKSEEECKQNESVLQTGVIPINAKQTQTPKKIPEEEIVLSTSAELGRYAYETLCSGDALTDHLIAAIIVEYLKSFNDIKGFVIINYPNAYVQVQILEDIFLGRTPPDAGFIDNEDDIYLEPCIGNATAKVKDIYELVRCSKLVKDPHIKIEDTTFVSYFTAYINLKESVDILDEIFIWDLTGDNSEIIDRYFAIQSINYSMYYELIDKELLAIICKYIIGDFEMPLKDPDSLFGVDVLSVLEFPSSEDKRQKSKIVKPEASTISAKSKDKLRKGSKSSKLAITPKAEEEVEPPIPEAEITPEVETRSYEEEESVIVHPGDENWIYADLPLADNFSVALATMWEEFERSYISDIGMLFFAKRLQINNIIPYTRFARDKMEQIITRPSKKQDLIATFHKQYNEYEDDWRYNNVTKNEWHCRIKELQTALYNICDERKRDAMSERQRLIYENWTMEELTAMANTYISSMQCEINRATFTYQLLHDFYFTMMKRPATSDRLVPKDLTKIVTDVEDSPRSKRSADDKLVSKLKTAFQEMHMKNSTIDQSNNPFNSILENNLKLGVKIIKELNDQYRTLIGKELSEISKISTSTKPKKVDEDGDANEPDEEFIKQNLMKCLEEWNVAVNGEMNRVNIRLQMLLNKAYIDLKLFNDFMSKMFLELEEEINEYYMREIKSVDRLCKYFQLAVEQSEKIRPTLILELDNFFIDPNLLQFPSPPPTPPPEIVERDLEGEFRVAQLARLREYLKLVAPTGIILEQNFTYLLQDFILYGKESCSGPLIPRAWRKLEPEHVPKLVFQLFGEVAYLDWRDFLIYCVGIRFPNIEELLELRKMLRCTDKEGKELVTREDFLGVEFWFEPDLASEDPCVQLRTHKIKQFLFELYETSTDLMNYPAFLLALCKDDNPNIGFASAISMAVGERVCYNLDECEPAINKLIELKEYKEACRNCAIQCAQVFVNALIDNVMQYCEGTTITEIEVTPSLLKLEAEASKKKGGKQKTPKGKGKSDTSTPRITKQKSSQSKTKMGTVDIKKDESPEPIESPKELEADADEKTMDTQIDTVRTSQQDIESLVPSDIVYSVSQEVIWRILEVCLPWQFKFVPLEKETEYIVRMTEVLTELGKDTESGDVYVAKFLDDQFVCKTLHKVRKFHALNLMQIVCTIVTKVT